MPPNKTQHYLFKLIDKKTKIELIRKIKIIDQIEMKWKRKIKTIDKKIKNEKVKYKKWRKKVKTIIQKEKRENKMKNYKSKWKIEKNQNRKIKWIWK